MKQSLGVVALALGILPAGQLIGETQTAKEIPKETQQAIGSQLIARYTLEPFNPVMPDHVYMQTDPDKLTFLHFAKPVTEPDNKLIFIGDGIKGRFCAEEQPASGKTGYVHFHRVSPAPSAHGGEAGDEGYWLRHIAVDEFDMMGTHFTPGVAYHFMPTPPPKCG